MNKKVLISGFLVLSLLLSQPLTAFAAKPLPDFGRRIVSGQLNVSLNPATRVASNIQAGTNNIELATFDLSAVKENINIVKLGVRIGGTINAGAVKNARLVDNNGVTIFGPTAAANRTGLFTFVQNATVLRDSRLTLKFIVDIDQSAANGARVTASIPSASAIVAIGGQSRRLIIPSGRFPVTGNPMTVSQIVIVNAGSLNVSNNPTLVAGEIPVGTMDAAIMKINLTASDIEDVELRGLTVKLTGPNVRNNLGIVKFINESTNAVIYTTAIVNADGTVGGNFGSFLTIRHGATAIIRVTADIRAGNLGDTVRCEVENAAAINAIGRSSGEAVEIIGEFPVIGPTMTLLADSELVVALSVQSPVGRLSAGHDISLAAYDFIADNEEILVRDVKVKISSTNVANIQRVSFWVDNNLVYSGVPRILDNQTVEVGGALNSNFTVQRNWRKTLFVKADLMDGQPGDVIRVQIKRAEDITAVGLVTATISRIIGPFPLFGNTLMY